jgi:putative flippase GtrA
MSRVAFRTGGGLRAGAVIGRLRAMSPSAETVLRRARRFAAVGGLCTLLAFVVFDQLTRGGMHVAPANACTWALSVGLGFVLNRRVTFSIRDRAAVGRHALRYVTGSAAQLAASSLLLTALVDGLGWPPRGAWLATLALMAGLMFAYLNLFAFTAAPGRSPAAPRPAPG